MKVKLCKQVKSDDTITMFKQNNVTCLQQLQQPVVIHYDRDHSPIQLYSYSVLGIVGGATHGFVCTCIYIRVLVTRIDMT